MTESAEDMRNFNLAEHRKSLFGLLGHILVVSKEKFDMEKADNRTRQAWGRLIVQGVEAYAHLLETIHLDVLEQRVSKLETHGGIENEKQNLGKTNSTA